MNSKSQQLDLFAPQLVITTRTVCTECTPAQCQRIVDYMRERGIDVAYGGTGPTPKQEWTAAASAAFLRATDEIWR